MMTAERPADGLFFSGYGGILTWGLLVGLTQSRNREPMAQATEHLFRQATVFLQAGKLDDAERGFRKLLRRDPKNFGTLNLLAIVLMQLGRYAEAEPFIKTALTVNAKNDATF